MTNKTVIETWNKGTEDEYVLVVLKCGHSERFWKLGLSREEYIKRTRELKKLKGISVEDEGF